MESPRAAYKPFSTVPVGDGKKVTVIEYENPDNNRFGWKSIAIDLANAWAQIPKYTYWDRFNRVFRAHRTIFPKRARRCPSAACVLRGAG
jgi:hypothetical protein